MSCGFDSGFDSGFEICVEAPTKGRKPVRVSIASKSIDLLAITDEQLVETHVLLAGSTSAETVTYPAAVLVERVAAGIASAETRTAEAEVWVDRTAAGHARAALISDAAVGIINDDLEILYLAGVL